jgi:hypothetical protein
MSRFVTLDMMQNFVYVIVKNVIVFFISVAVQKLANGLIALRMERKSSVMMDGRMKIVLIVPF